MEDLGEEFDKIDENGGGQVMIQMMVMINRINRSGQILLIIVLSESETSKLV